MRKITYIFIAILFCSLSACFVTKISSNKKADYHEYLNRVFINGSLHSTVAQYDKMAQNMGDSLCSALVQNFATDSVVSTYTMQGPLSLLSKADIAKSITDFQPKQKMDIRFMVSNPDSASVMSIEISITDVGSNAIIWKGFINKVSAISIHSAVNKCTRLITNQLVQDGLLPTLPQK